MKHSAMVLMASILIIAGCVYKVPLADEQNLPLDPSVLGLWEAVPNEGEALDPGNRMLILKYTDTEYLVHCPTGPEGMYFRGYPVKIGDVSCVQLQEVGTADGQIKDEDRKYHVVSYSLSNGELEIRTLNTDLVDDNLQESAELKRAFLNNEKDKDLFKVLRKFRKAANKK